MGAPLRWVWRVGLRAHFSNPITFHVLINNRASHSFISCKLVSKFDLPTQSFARSYIKLGDGHRVHLLEKCEHMNISLGDFSCQLDALVF